MAPLTVIVAAVLQLLLAVAFLMMAVIAYRYGQQAQRAAEAEVARQGYSKEILIRNGVKFSQRGLEALLPVTIAIVLAAIGVLNLAGVNIGRTLTWVLQPLVLVAGGLVTGLQVFAANYIRRSFNKATDPSLCEIDVASFMDAAQKAFPNGFRALVTSRFLLATLGSIIVIILLKASPQG